MWKLENRCLRTAPPKKWPFFGQKWPKIPNFGQKSSVLGLGCAIQNPPTLFWRCVTPKNMYCMALKLENGCFRAAHPKNGHFLPKSGLRMSILGPKHCFFRIGRSVQGPPTLFCRCLTRKYIGCMVWNRKIGISGAPHPKKNNHFLPKNGLKLAILGKKAMFLGLGAQFWTPLPYCFGA